MNLNFTEMPGYVLDLFFIFSLNFNDEDKFVTFNNGLTVERIIEIKKHFGSISESLQLFFAIKKNGRGFISTNYFSRYSNIMSKDYNFDFLINELENDQEFIERLIVFYFPELEGQVSNYKGDIAKIAPLIDNSEYSEVIKRKLYSFFINPKPLIQKLICELKIKERLLSEYYKDNMALIINTKRELLENEGIIVDICSHLNISGFNESSLYVSPCLINQDCLWAFGRDNIELLIVGCNYKNVLSYYDNLVVTSDLCGFGDVFSEKNRIDILRFIKLKGTITIKDLERHLNFTGSTAYYHLTMMLKENMIVARNQGRTVIYSINTQYFKSIISQLEEFT